MSTATRLENPFDNPFPGMNPYLESRRLWREVHNSLIALMKSYLRRTLPFRYSVIMEERLGIGVEAPDGPPYRYIEPDLTVIGGEPLPTAAAVRERDAGSVVVTLPFRETIREFYITISDRNADADEDETVTILEVLSPSNKRAGVGRAQYEDKRGIIFESSVHLVEIDLVRRGRPMPAEGYHGDAPYRHLVSRWPLRPRAALYPFGLQSPIPDVTVPLLEGDAEPKIPLGELLHNLYREDYYANYVNYNRDPEGPLSDADRAWLDGLLRAKGLRR